MEIRKITGLWLQWHYAHKCQCFVNGRRVTARSVPKIAEGPILNVGSAITCILQVIRNRLPVMPDKRRSNAKRRSGCPVSVSLEVFGDRWSLLIVRDLMVRGYRSFREFQESGEGIATNILADRLSKLEAAGIVAALPEESDRRKINYRLTRKG